MDDQQPYIADVESDVTKLESLIDLAKILGQQSDYDEVLRLVVEKASSLANADAALVMMINPRTRDTIKTLYAEKNTDDEFTRFVHTNISGWVIVHNASLLSADIRCDPRFRKNLFQKAQAKSALCLPFKVGNTIIGTLLLLNSERGGSFTANDLATMDKLSAVASPFLHCAQTVAQYFVSALPGEALLKKYSMMGLYGKSKKFLDLLHSIEAASRSDVRILLVGESGTGKELVARAIHQLSARSHNAFVAIDCGAIQPNLVESELFGHIKGAFTGAATDRKGLFEEANNGTLFMDEVNNLPVDMQSKLLRVLQDEEIRPVGSNLTRKVNVRIIAASSSPLRAMVLDRKFREDLYYRLNVYPILVPSLRERVEDIPLLAGHFLKESSREQHKAIEGFDEEVLDFMKHHRWDGNIRELENFVERLVTLATKKETVIDRGVLPPELEKELKKAKRHSEEIQTTKSLGEGLAEYEEQLIRRALDDCNWNQSKAARALQISEHSLRYKMRRLKIEKLS
jgi:transcriptional regulator with GAF, ATPase, and Fis domain